MSTINFGTSLGLTGGKCFIKNIFDIKTDWFTWNIWCVKFYLVLSICSFGNNLGLIGGNYLVILDIIWAISNWWSTNALLSWQIILKTFV